MAKVLILGASGMLGHAVLRVVAATGEHDVIGAVRSEAAMRLVANEFRGQILLTEDVQNQDILINLFGSVRPDVVVNCIGVIKQIATAYDPLIALPINSLLPHRLAYLSGIFGARLIHISTDCVFSGNRGGYTEEDIPDAMDLYGRSKLLGEVTGPGTITLRTSIIGTELASTNGLLSWFLSQKHKCLGYTKAIFSGLPTNEVAGIIRDLIIPDNSLTGLYHVASDPIAKFDLLRIIAKVYGVKTEVIPDDRVTINRSLRADRFMAATGYVPPLWPELIRNMHKNG
jgi:dTDP-4-dehydrorhamnose reductase